WVKVTSKLGINFAVVANVTQYARQLVEQDAQGVETGKTYVISYSDAFITVSDRSIQEKENGATFDGKTGDWVKVTSKLGINFAVVANVTQYARQLVEKDAQGVETGKTYVISYSDAFITVSDRSIQEKENGATFDGKTGDWVKVTSKLGINFAVVANVTQYARQLVEKDAQGVETGKTYVISYSDAFITVSDRSIQEKENGATFDGKTGDWVKVTSKLGINFAVVANVTQYARQLVEKDAQGV